MHLLDINVLIALADPAHVHHEAARGWFLSSARQAWATCPLIENGFIRILGQSAYPGFSGGPNEARAMLRSFTALPGHQFWPDQLSLLDAKTFPELPVSKHFTDLYLLALAASNRGRLVTFDQRIDPSMVPGGGAAYFIVLPVM